LTHNAVQLWGKSILISSRIKVFVKDLSNIDPSGTYIFMSNLQSNFDNPVLQAYISPHFKWLASPLKHQTIPVIQKIILWKRFEALFANLLRKKEDVSICLK